jgi:hypothetical protein
MQAAPGPQALPQLPQLKSSVERMEQVLPQSVYASPHRLQSWPPSGSMPGHSPPMDDRQKFTQTPFAQPWPAAGSHSWPQLPQLASSV